MKKIITHNGNFHADDVFAVATLSIYLDKVGEKYRIIRTRDEEIIEKGDFVLDVGGIYDEDENRFDHHQSDFKEVGFLKIPYSSFGLIWQKYGDAICENKHVVKNFTQDFVTQIDANDSGIDIYNAAIEGLVPLDPEIFVKSFIPSDAKRTEEALYDGFLEAVDFARGFISREIEKYKDKESYREEFEQVIKSKKNIIKTDSIKALVLPRPLPWKYFMDKETDFDFVIYQRDDGNWQARGLSVSPTSMKIKVFKKTWAGLREEELSEKAGVKDLVFYHKTGYILVGKTKDSILKTLELF